MIKIPLKVQIGIRDHWEKPDSPVQQSIEKLKNATGYEIRIQPEWNPLLAELDAFYPDKAIFVPCVAAAVDAFCTALTAIVNDDANAQFADILMEQVDGVDRTIRIFLEVSKGRDTKLSWSEQQRGFIIAIPKGPIPSQSYLGTFFHGAFLKVFDKASPSHPAESTTTDDWADVSVDNATGKAGISELPQRPKDASHFDTMPSIDTVPRPDDLLLQPPYHLIVYDLGKTLVEVQCSHSPTLQFLADYLQKWSKINYNNTTRPPRADVKLHESAFGLGPVYDRLTIESQNKYQIQNVSAVLVVALAEGVLGYKSVSTDRSMWSFRRDVGFTNM